MPEVKRSYNRTSFYAFIGCVIITLFMDYLGISAEQVSAYVSGVVTKTYNNLSIFMIWLGPILIGLKEYKEDKRKAEDALKLEIERLRAGK